MSRSKNYIYYILLSLAVLLGIFLRTKMYISGGVFEDDECRLACSMFSLNIWQMFGPIGPWSSSPVFMFISKIVAHFSGYNEYALQFIPYLASIISIFLFYKLSCEIFDKKYSVIIGMFLFGINTNLIYFSSVFKHYGIELLIGILCLYYMPKIKFSELSKKQLIVLSSVVAALPLISLPSLFYTASFITVSLYENFKNKSKGLKKILKFLLPLGIVMLFYYTHNLAPTKIMQLSFYGPEWEDFYSTGFLNLILGNIFYFFRNSGYEVTLLLLICITIFGICFNKSQRKPINIYPVLVLGFVIFASITHIYPFMSRVATHLIPILIYLIIKPLEMFSDKKIPFYIIVILLFLGLGKYFSPDGIKGIYTCEGALYYSPSSLMKTVSSNFQENDNIIINEASASSYYFYAKKYKIPNFEKICTIIQTPGEETENIIKNTFNNLDTDKNYWIYIVKDFNRFPSNKYITKWANKQNIKLYQQERSSYLYYIVPPYTRYE